MMQLITREISNIYIRYIERENELLKRYNEMLVETVNLLAESDEK